MPSKRWASPCSSSSSKKGAGTRPSSTQTSGEASFQCLPLRWNKRRSSSVPLHIKHSCSLHAGRRVSVGLSPPKVAGGGLMQRQVRQTVPRASSSSGRCPRNLSLVTSRRSAAGKEVLLNLCCQHVEALARLPKSPDGRPVSSLALFHGFAGQQVPRSLNVRCGDLHGEQRTVLLTRFKI